MIAFTIDTECKMQAALRTLADFIELQNDTPMTIYAGWARTYRHANLLITISHPTLFDAKITVTEAN